MPRIPLGAWLKGKRKIAGKTLFDASGESGISESKLKRIESCQTYPRSDDIEALCSSLRINPAEYWNENPLPYEKGEK